MDDARIGTAFRAIRQRKGWRQEDLAARSGVSRWLVSRLEGGHLEEVGLAATRRIAKALGARLDVALRWQGGDLDRLLNRRHSAMHETVARMLTALGGWEFAPEVSFSIYGERGIIDVLAWHPVWRALLVIELKTEIVDVNDLMGGVDGKRRLARAVASSRGWSPLTVSVWVAVRETPTNRRRLRAHAAVLRAAFPGDGRQIRQWLHKPVGSIAALGFLSEVGEHSTMSRNPGRRRVRATPEASAPVAVSTEVSRGTPMAAEQAVRTNATPR